MAPNGGGSFVSTIELAAGDVEDGDLAMLLEGVNSTSSGLKLNQLGGAVRMTTIPGWHPPPVSLLLTCWSAKDALDPAARVDEGPAFTTDGGHTPADA